MRAQRLLVWTFLAAFAFCGFARVEAWPLTSWRLFSHARRPVQVSREAVVVDPAGRERALPLRALGEAYRGTTLVLGRFPSIGDERRLAACDAWADGARRHGIDAIAVRVYRVVRDVGDRAGRRGAPPRERTLEYTCVGGAVREERP